VRAAEPQAVRRQKGRVVLWFLLVGVVLPALLIVAVLTRDRYWPWFNTHRASIFLAAGFADLAVGVAHFVKGIGGVGGWVRAVWSLVIACWFFWLSSQARRELRRESAA
jgi:hypothetical protein